jgi:CspA family cold shock protein
MKFWKTSRTPRSRSRARTVARTFNNQKHESLKMSEVVEIGVVKFFNEAKGYGFLERENGKPNVFVHANDCPYGVVLIAGQRVQFNEETDKKKPDRTHAANVKPVGHAPVGAWRDNDDI